MILSRHVVDRYADEWTVGIEDLTPLVRRIRALLDEGRASRARDLLPPERVYPVGPEIAARIRAG